MTTKRKAAFSMPTHAADLDQWVAGADAPPEPAAAPQETPAAKPARLTIDLPPDVHARFKAACAIRRVQMVDVVREAIDHWMRESGKS